MSNNTPKAAVYVQPDIADGDYSVDQLTARNTAQQEAAAKAAMATWHESPSLTDSQVKILDGVNGGNYPRRWDSTPRNEIGQPKAIASKNPAGYSSTELDLGQPSDSDPVSLKSTNPAKKSVAEARDSNVKGS
jgi:hypothetical protein